MVDVDWREAAGVCARLTPIPIPWGWKPNGAGSIRSCPATRPRSFISDQAAQLHQRAVALEALAYRPHGGGAAREPVGDQADDPGKHVMNETHSGADPTHGAGKLDGVAAQLVRRLLLAPRALGRNHNRFQRVQRARQPRRQTVRQKAEGRMALGAIPASDPRTRRRLALIGPVPGQRTAAPRMVRVPLKPCPAPCPAGNVPLAGKLKVPVS